MKYEPTPILCKCGFVLGHQHYDETGEAVPVSVMYAVYHVCPLREKKMHPNFVEPQQPIRSNE